MVTFLRRSWNKYKKLGKGIKKNRKWRSPKGRDNKMREKRRGYPAVVSIGYGTDKKFAGKINDKKPVIVNNINEVAKVGKEQVAILGNVGKKKKIEIAKKAKEMKIEIYNLNIEKFLKGAEKKK